MWTLNNYILYNTSHSMYIINRKEKKTISINNFFYSIYIKVLITYMKWHMKWQEMVFEMELMLNFIVVNKIL